MIERGPVAVTGMYQLTKQQTHLSVMLATTAHFGFSHVINRRSDLLSRSNIYFKNMHLESRQ